MQKRKGGCADTSLQSLRTNNARRLDFRQDVRRLDFHKNISLRCEFKKPWAFERYFDVRIQRTIKITLHVRRSDGSVKSSRKVVLSDASRIKTFHQ